MDINARTLLRQIRLLMAESHQYDVITVFETRLHSNSLRVRFVSRVLTITEDKTLVTFKTPLWYKL